MNRSKYWGYLVLLAAISAVCVYNILTEMQGGVLIGPEILSGPVALGAIGICLVYFVGIQYQRAFDISQKNGFYLFLLSLITTFVFGVGFLFLGLIPSERDNLKAKKAHKAKLQEEGLL